MLRRLEELGFWPSLLIAGSCGFILSIGSPPDGRLFGHWLGYVPLILMVRRHSISWKQALYLGLAGGMGVGLGGFPWIAEMLVKFVRVPGFVGFIGLLFFSLWMAIPYGLWAVGLRLGPFDGMRARLWGAGLFAALQFLWPTLFPYTPLLGFAEQPEWMQLAEFGGVHLVESIVILWAVFCADLVTASDPKRRVAFAAVAVMIPPLVYGHGVWRMQVMDEVAKSARSLRVGLVQPNVPVGGAGRGLKLKRLQEASERAAHSGAEVIIWPEAGTFPFRVARPLVHGFAEVSEHVRPQRQLPIVMGVNARHPDEDFGYNSAILIDADNRVRGEYDKVNLVPLGEYIPIFDPTLLTRIVPQIGHHFAGEGPTRFVLEPEMWREEPPEGAGRASPIALGPLICYEDIIPTFVRKVAAQEGGIELFVNLTIDAWYGFSAEPWEHLALAQFRSIEHRIPMVRSVSTGVSAVIDHNGRLAEHIPSRPVHRDNMDEIPPESLVATVVLPRNTRDHPTFYARVGWLYPWLCVASASVVIGRAARRRHTLQNGRAPENAPVD
jgi:apolipoprotein N-acyltransferase